MFFYPEKTLVCPFYTTPHDAAPVVRWNPPAAAAPSSSSSTVPVPTPMMYTRRIGTPFVKVAEHHIAMVSLPFRTKSSHGTGNPHDGHSTLSEELDIVFLLPESRDGLPELEVHCTRVIECVLSEVAIFLEPPTSYNYRTCMYSYITYKVKYSSVQSDLSGCSDRSQTSRCSSGGCCVRSIAQRASK